MESELASTIQYLKATQEGLLAQARGVDLNYYPPDGGWSAGQVLAHLIRTEKYLYPLFWTGGKLGLPQSLLNVINRVNISASKLAGMGFISNGEKIPEGMSNLTLQFKGRFKAPAFLKPGKRDYELEALLVKREKVRSRTLGLVSSVPFHRLATLRFSHPVLGSFTLLEFFVFLGKHEEWHTEQIKRILANQQVNQFSNSPDNSHATNAV
ncbi:MAG TPA: DinB family protein [Blastocatellia bacterium]|nr:DinB family protein [Blastocatellia bacterium]